MKTCLISVVVAGVVSVALNVIGVTFWPRLVITIVCVIAALQLWKWKVSPLS